MPELPDAPRCRPAAWAGSEQEGKKTTVRCTSLDDVRDLADDMPELESAPSKGKGAADDDDEDMPPLTRVIGLREMR